MHHTAEFSSLTEFCAVNISFHVVGSSAIKHFLKNSLKGSHQCWITWQTRMKYLKKTHVNKLKKQLKDHLGLSLL